MKNIILKITLLLAVFVFVAGCTKKNEKTDEAKQNQNLINTEAYNNLEKVNLGNDKVTLQYQFKPGDKFSYKLTTLTSTDQTVQADSTLKSKSNQSATYNFDFNVLKVDKDKNADLSVTISSMKIDADNNGQKITYDSKANNSPEIKSKFMEYETITNMPYNVKLDANGNIVNISNLDKMVEKLNAMQPSNQKLNAQQKEQLKNSIAEAALKPITQLIFRELPNHAVGKDSTWTKNYPGSLAVFQLQNTAKFKVDDFVKVNGARAAKISAILSAKATGNKQGTDSGVTYNFSDPIISGGGIMLFNIDNGKLIKAETSTRVEMNVQLEMKDAAQKTKKTTRKDITTNKNIIELI